MAFLRWAVDTLFGLNIRTRSRLEDFYGRPKAIADHQIKLAALNAGWEQRQGQDGRREMFSPGTARRYDLSLPVFDGDRLQPDVWDRAYDARGIHFGDIEKALAFIRKRLEGESIDGG